MAFDWDNFKRNLEKLEVDSLSADECQQVLDYMVQKHEELIASIKKAQEADIGTGTSGQVSAREGIIEDGKTTTE